LLACLLCLAFGVERALVSKKSSFLSCMHACKSWEFTCVRELLITMQVGSLTQRNHLSYMHTQIHTNDDVCVCIGVCVLWCGSKLDWIDIYRCRSIYMYVCEENMG
jgi:hypothetical protein